MSVSICQSCGMPLNKEENRGTNSDNTKTEEYCKFCFQNGKFVNEKLTMQDQIDKSVEVSKKMWIPEQTAREIAMNTIPKLKRWQK